MKNLLDYIIKNLLAKGSKYEIEQTDEGSVIKLIVKTSDEDGGLIIGKGGKVIKAIRNMLRVKATLEKKKVVILVNPSE